MRKRLAIVSISFLVLANLGTLPVAAEDGTGCYLLDSWCDRGSQCCSHICETHPIGHATCTNG
jgi:hypothetical protein